MEYAVKFVQGSDDLIEGMLAPFGSTDRKDLDGEFFDGETDFVLDWFGDWQRPSLFGHGFDPAMKTSVVGRLKVDATEKGLWAKAQLDKAHAYYEQVKELIDEGALGWSSGSVDHLVEIDAKSGHIKRWPLIEGSLTPTPANPDARGVRYAAKSADVAEHLAVLGVAVPQAIKDTDAPPTEEPEDETPEELTVEPATKDHIWDAIKSVLSPQSLHDAAVSSGAVCAESETPEPPQPVLAVGAAKQAFDLDAFRAELNADVREAVQSYLKP